MRVLESILCVSYALPSASFMNGPVTGTDVFIPMDMIIGGQTRLGFGWNMLMVRIGEEVTELLSTLNVSVRRA